MTDKPDIVERPHRGSEKILDELNALRAQRDQARDAFRKYGRHDHGCFAGKAARWGRGDPSCVCGFSAALAKLEEE